MSQIASLNLILFILFLWSFAVLLFFYFRYYLAFGSYKSDAAANSEAVSVIVAAKNEAGNLQNFLPRILNQKYANFELLVVDDHSSDNSIQVLEALASQYPNLSYYRQEKTKVGKKAAIQKAIQKAKNDLLLFIDADCYPSSRNWIQMMADSCKGDIQIVLGYGRYEKKDYLLNKLVRYDTLLTGIRYLSYAMAGEAYMSVGRNLMYRRDIYDRSTVFERLAYFPYGDDDLIVNEMSTKNNTAVCFAPAAHTVSIPKQSWKAFFVQKIRHLSAGKFYRSKHKTFLILESMARILFILTALSLLIMGHLKIAIFIGILWLLQCLVFYRACSNLKDKDLIKYLPLLEVIHIFFLGFCSLFSIFNKKVSWK